MEILSADGFEVDTAENGAVAVEKVRTAAPGQLRSGADGRADADHGRLHRHPRASATLEDPDLAGIAHSRHDGERL